MGKHHTKVAGVAPTKKRKSPSELGLAPIREWLTSHNAQLVWSVDIPNVGPISAYIVNMRVIILQVYQPTKVCRDEAPYCENCKCRTDEEENQCPEERFDGWDAYVAVARSNELSATLKALGQHIQKPVRRLAEVDGEDLPEPEQYCCEVPYYEDCKCRQEWDTDRDTKGKDNEQ